MYVCASSEYSGIHLVVWMLNDCLGRFSYGNMSPCTNKMLWPCCSWVYNTSSSATHSSVIQMASNNVALFVCRVWRAMTMAQCECGRQSRSNGNGDVDIDTTATTKAIKRYRRITSKSSANPSKWPNTFQRDHLYWSETMKKNGLLPLHRSYSVHCTAVWL